MSDIDQAIRDLIREELADGSSLDDAVAECSTVSDMSYKLEDLEYKVQNFEDYN